MKLTKHYNFRKDTLGKRIACTRKQRRLTQADLASFIGLPLSTVVKYEDDTRLPSLTTFKNLVLILGVSADYLLGLSSNKKFDKK